MAPLLLALVSGCAQAQDELPCPQLLNRAYDAYTAGDAQHLEQISASSDHCPGQVRQPIYRWTAQTLWRDINVQPKTQPPAALQDALEHALGYAGIWPLHATLGDLHFRAKDYIQATHHYQQAIDAIADEELTPTGPGSDTIDALMRKGGISRQLAPQYIAHSRGSRGEPSGLGRARVRGHQISQEIVPIEFALDRPKRGEGIAPGVLTPKGIDALDDLVEQMMSQNPAAVTFVGYTDEQGSEAYNCALSQRRAEAIRTHLAARGFSGRIDTRGGCISQVADLKLPDDVEPDIFTLEELRQLKRRVELLR
ncbi:MAG: OmpA family protein [Candidatus Competibacterales bacterium]